MPKKNSSWSLQTSGKSVPGYEKKMQLPQEPLNKKPRGLARKSMVVTNFVELCGAATVSSSFEGKRESNHEHIAWSRKRS